MSSQKGISLVEVLVTLCLISLGTVLLVMLLNSGYKNVNEIRAHQNAYILAQNKLEELSAFSLNKQKNSTSESDEITMNYQRYIRKWTVTEKLEPYKHKSVDVSVYWYDESNTRVSIKVSGMLSEVSPDLSGKILLAE
ncbi:hypothetical protein L3V82_03780 [Thiotrichales bacterium 19S3-7]|nr:hypothetical protein [Thiotrichales bacterium 19S3-7]MCF6801233.1 hypothetical protein [Thiotrichales bacterium 19S3-11]